VQLPVPSMHHRLLLAAVLFVWVCLVVAAPAAQAQTARVGADRTAVERASSAKPAPGSVQVTVVVAPRVVARVDGLGRPTAVMTNSGRPPAEGDSFLLMTDDGTTTPLPAEVVDRIRAVSCRIDWSEPGRWHRVGSAERIALVRCGDVAWAAA
jgi:hypothetical protein